MGEEVIKKMELKELKGFLKIDGEDLDDQIIGYQKAAEIYLKNAGAIKNYENHLYKIAITIVVATLLENPMLFVSGTIVAEVKGISLAGIVAQLRHSESEVEVI